MSASAPAGADIPEGFRPRRFGEGFIAVNGPLYVRRQDGGFQLGFRVEQRHCNPMGICHGGMMATFCDMLLPLSAHVLSDVGKRFLQTINLQIDYLAASPLGAYGCRARRRCCARREASSSCRGWCMPTAPRSPASASIFKIGPPFDDALEPIPLPGP